MTKEEIRDYQERNPIWYFTKPPLTALCPINYDWDKCSEKEYRMSCRTCINYNPLRMLYEKEFKKGNLKFGVPMEVLLIDVEIQLQ